MVWGLSIPRDAGAALPGRNLGLGKGPPLCVRQHLVGPAPPRPSPFSSAASRNLNVVSLRRSPWRGLFPSPMHPPPSRTIVQYSEPWRLSPPPGVAREQTSLFCSRTTACTLSGGVYHRPTYGVSSRPSQCCPPLVSPPPWSRRGCGGYRVPFLDSVAPPPVHGRTRLASGISSPGLHPLRTSGCVPSPSWPLPTASVWLRPRASARLPSLDPPALPSAFGERSSARGAHDSVLPLLPYPFDDTVCLVSWVALAESTPLAPILVRLSR